MRDDRMSRPLCSNGNFNSNFNKKMIICKGILKSKILLLIRVTYR